MFDCFVINKITKSKNDSIEIIVEKTIIRNSNLLSFFFSKVLMFSTFCVLLEQIITLNIYCNIGVNLYIYILLNFIIFGIIIKMIVLISKKHFDFIRPFNSINLLNIYKIGYFFLFQ